MIYICIAFSIIIPYLLCSINPAIIIAKLKSGKDIREMGSGGAGLTNALRTQGKKVAGLVLLFDVLKGVVAIVAIRLFCWNLGSGQFEDMSEYLPFCYMCMWIGSLAGVLGHCFPIWHKFKGGKAALVTVATGFVINWLAALIALTLFILIVLATRYVSLGSMISAVMYVAAVGLTEVYLYENPAWYIGVIFCGLIAVVIVYKHKDNIKRLIAGNENKLGRKKS